MWFVIWLAQGIYTLIVMLVQQVMILIKWALEATDKKR